MFWWLVGSTNASAPRAAQPLVMWLQGGPGAASSGYGNMQEIGPLNMRLEPRNTTWAQSANLLFVDQPVGTGYSYCNDVADLTTNLTGIVDDLLAFTSAFFTSAYPALTATPFWGFSESYGGKMMSGYAAGLLAAMDAGAVPTLNFKGVALGDSWICGQCYVNAWGPWLRYLSVMDAWQYTQSVAPLVAATNAAVAAGAWLNATAAWGAVEDAVGVTTDDIDWYNVLRHHTQSGFLSAAPPRLSAAARRVLPAGASPDAIAALYARHVAAAGGSAALGESLNTLMNGAIRAKLGIIPANVTWGGQSDAVFTAQSGDFMRPVIDVVDGLLIGGRISVTVYTGQLDLICTTAGTEAWMGNLTWPGYAAFSKSVKTPLYPSPASTSTGAFRRQYQQLAMYYIMDAGHMVPADNGVMALQMLQRVTGLV